MSRPKKKSIKRWQKIAPKPYQGVSKYAKDRRDKRMAGYLDTIFQLHTQPLPRYHAVIRTADGGY